MKAYSERDVFNGIRLVSLSEGGSTLDRYVFQGEQHAYNWLQQEYLGDVNKDYSLEYITYNKRSCCGQIFRVKVVRPLSVDVFLKEYKDKQTRV